MFDGVHVSLMRGPKTTSRTEAPHRPHGLYSVEPRKCSRLGSLLPPKYVLATAERANVAILKFVLLQRCIGALVFVVCTKAESRRQVWGA